MSTTLFLVRHGETEWNALGKFQGCIDIELSKEGIFQANLLKEKIENSFDYIYSSPLKRALDTNEFIALITSKDPINLLNKYNISTLSIFGKCIYNF